MGNPAGHEDFVDLIYQASIDAKLWPSVLERLVDLIDGEGATLHWYDLFTGASAGVGVRVNQEALDKGFADFSHCNPLTEQDPVVKRRLLRDFTPRIRRDTDWLPKEDFLRSAYYNDFFQAFGFHSDVGLGIMCEDMGEGRFEGAGINAFRHKRKGPWTDDEMALCASLHPHLVRAYKLGRKIAAKQGLGEDLSALIDRSPHGLFMLDRQGRVRHFNATAQALISERGGLTILGGRLAAERPDDTRRLQQLIDLAATPDAEQRCGGAMALATPCRRHPLSLIVSPLRGERVALFPSGSDVVVCVSDLEASVSLPERQLRQLFSLTPAEGRVALSVLDGLEPAQAAQRLGLGLATVRTHLAHIFDKTNTTGQVGLISLMMRAVGIAPP
jgi:DNA-binding CsgD family transcriptional regulator/PAS domain-containing protein